MTKISIHYKHLTGIALFSHLERLDSLVLQHLFQIQLIVYRGFTDVVSKVALVS